MIGKTISHYEIFQELGSGGMGVVYKAKDTRLKRSVALKFLPPELTSDSESKTRFIQEAQAASALEHPNICNIHEIDETDDDQLFIVMACYEGKTLQHKIQDKTLKIAEAIEYITQIARGLQKAHSTGIIHRDIKSSNIFITDDGLVKILDFGLAKLSGNSDITRKHSRPGTTSYMSPEQIRGEGIDHRTDIWSLGILLYEVLTGKLPFSAEYEQTIMYAILSKDPENPRKLNPEIPAELESIIFKMLAKNPDRRYMTVDEFLHDLQKVGNEKVLLKETRLSNQLGRLFDFKNLRYLSIPLSIILIIIILLILWQLFPRGGLAKPTTVAVIGFENNTGEASLDYLKTAIPSLLITSLSQENRFQIISLPKLYELKSQMDIDDATEINTETGFEICQRYNIPIIIVGSFIKAGEVFASDVKVMNVSQKTILASASSRGVGVNSLIEKQIDDMSMQIIDQLGYSSKTFNRQYKPVKSATTHSMDAYNFYVKATQHQWEFENRDERKKLLELAIEADSTFAGAYSALADFYGNKSMKRAECYRKARQYSRDVPEVERLLIEAKYYKDFENNVSKAIEILENAIEKYPQAGQLHYQLALMYHGKGRMSDAFREYRKTADLEPYLAMNWNQLAYEYSRHRRYNEALACLEKYAELAPGHPNAYDSMGDIFLHMGELDKAIERYRKSLALGWENEKVHLAYVFALKEDYNKSVRLWQSCVPCVGDRPDFEYFGSAFYYYFAGRRQDMMRELAKLDTVKGYTGTRKCTEYWYIARLFEAWIYFEEGHYQEGLKSLTKSRDFLLKSYQRFGSNFFAMYDNYYQGLVKVRQNLPDSAKSYLEKMKDLPPFESEVTETFSKYYRERLLLEILLAKEKNKEALQRIDSLDIPGMVHKIYPLLIFYNLPFRDDIIPRIYLANNEIDKAIKAYENIVIIGPEKSHDRRLIPPWFHLHLAKLYESQGQTEKALHQYQHLLNIWNNADRDIPELIEAKERLSVLQEI